MTQSKNNPNAEAVGSAQSGGATVGVVEPIDADVTPGGVTDADLDTAELSDGGHQTSTASTSTTDADDVQSRRLGKSLAIGLAACLVAAAAITTANSLAGSSTPAEVPLTVSDPSVILTALTDSGFDCRGSVVNGDVATCNSTIAVRIFADAATASSWVTRTLKDPMTNSSTGWVLHGNAVVAAPLTSTPEVELALGPGSQKF